VTFSVFESSCHLLLGHNCATSELASLSPLTLLSAERQAGKL